MELILVAILIVGIIAFVAYPLFGTSSARLGGTSTPLDTLIAQRESTYDAIRDLDFDFQMGKLSQADYAGLRDKYKTRAAQILQQIDGLGGVNLGADTDAQIEAQVARLRQTRAERGSDADGQIEAQIEQLRHAKTDPVENEIARVRASRKSANQFCAKCGTPRRADDKFCSKCGNRF